MSRSVAAMFLGVIPAQAQQSASPAASFVVRVVEENTRQPLPNAEVLVLGSDLRYLTNTRGDARVRRRGADSISIRVRQIGFLPETRTVIGEVGDTVIFSLSRVAYELPRVVTTADAACPEIVDATSAELSLRALEHLRFAAERYDSFRRQYPFRLEMGRRSVVRDFGKYPKEIEEQVGRVSSDAWRARYRPGGVLVRDSLGFSVPLLFLETLGDSTFWAHHCFVARGVELRDGKPMIRLEFAPTNRIRAPDWAGVVLLDSATSALRRVEFRLTGLKQFSRPRRLEGYSTFATPTPFIVVPDTTLAVWWKREPDRNGEWGDPDVAQMLYIRKLTWRKAKPPALQTESQ